MIGFLLDFYCLKTFDMAKDQNICSMEEERRKKKTNTKHTHTVRRLVLFIDDGSVAVACRQHASCCKRCVNDHIERQVTSENLVNARI